jgi:hypothetical protein
MIQVFEKEFLAYMRKNHQDVLNSLLTVKFPTDRRNELPEEMEQIILEAVETVKKSLPVE